MLKTCTRCLRTLALDEFYFERQRGRHCAQCRACKTAYQRSLREQQPEQVRKRNRASYRKNYDRQVRPYRLRRRYGLTVDEFDALAEKQGHRCAICERHETDQGHRGRDGNESKRLVVDHDHATGEVRGLLCHRCNRAMGLIREDVDALRRMLAYLDRGS